MFKNMRNRFLILNMVSISIVMIVAFSAIYVIVSNNIASSNRSRLRALSGFQNMPPAGQRINKPLLPREFSLSFAVEVDKNGQMVKEDSYFDISDDMYSKAVALAWSDRYKKNEKLHVDSKTWAYEIMPASGNFRIVMLDVTNSQQTLANLMATFMLVGSLTLIVLFIISILFANRTIKPVKEAWEKQKQFIADASHELKTPLAIIGANTEVLLSDAQEAFGDKKKWLVYIKDETSRMAKLTNELLYLAKIDYSDAKLLYADFDISIAADSVILSMEAIAFDHDIKLDHSIEPRVMAVGNPEQLERVMIILLDNAVKYATPASGAEGKWINITLKKNRHHVIFSVTNSSNGIAPDCTGKLFDRFYRADQSRTREDDGYGLGLSIAQAIAVQHKGSISIKSRMNVSVTFSLELPAA